MIGRRGFLTSRKISQEDAQRYADNNGMLYIETSAMHSVSVEKAFNNLSRKIIKLIKEKTIDPLNEES